MRQSAAVYRNVDADEAARLLARDAVRVLDVRTADEYDTAGHIPGARNAPWEENLGPDGRLKSRKELRQRFEERGGTFQHDAFVSKNFGDRAQQSVGVTRGQREQKLR